MNPQGRNKLPPGEKNHEKRPRQIELLFQCKGPVLPDNGIIKPAGQDPQMIVKSES
jgi:hypothetical protein